MRRASTGRRAAPHGVARTHTPRNLLRALRVRRGCVYDYGEQRKLGYVARLFVQCECSARVLDISSQLARTVLARTGTRL